ncbi:hypothetical protein F5J12DRAFT_783943 [Pisolithus orientalis]|uniref:uncharacterized protein n=1 Tax=Pisolithus orientalis TaxID=936130 RepID=UPI0022259E59|nr:uncharacterized protein F5J12DRAFT_783943 [Pisolithus orientalis]KAI6002176.1 hypothetical protein F5J12DRAFT_783943 [Pisolithus orientalis]
MVKFTLRKKARYATSQSNESPTRAGSSSIQEPNLVQGNDADLYCYMDDVSPPRTSRIPKSQSRYLSVLLDMEAPSDVMACFQHKLRQFHPVQKWNGRFFEDFTLQLVGLVLHLGHAGAPCLAGEGSWEDAASHVDEEWEDIKESQQLAHLNPLDDRNYLTVVDTGSMHFCNVQYCNCPGSEDSHLQLTMAGLFPAMTKAPRTAFTFQVLDDFIRDNVECGTSAMNYYNKLQRVTSSMFPHLVPGIAQGVENVEAPKAVEMAGIPSALPVPSQGSMTFVMDSNFKAEHMLPKDAAKEVWLMDGNGFMKSNCNNHWAVNQANAQRNKLESPGIGGCACVRHSCFVPHAMVNFQKGEQQVNMDYALVHAVHHGLDPQQLVITFYDINYYRFSPALDYGMSMAIRQSASPASALKQKFKVAKQSLATIQDKFNELDSKVPDGLHQLWVEQELVVQSCHWNTLQAMDIYEVQLEKAPTMKAIEIDLIHNNHSFSSSCGSATWIAQALKVEQAQIIDALVHGAAQFIRNDWQVNPRQRPRSMAPFNGDSKDKTDDLFLPDCPGHQEYFHDIGLSSLVEQEIHLRQGQANDALHELHMALVDKAVIFRTDVWKGGNYKMTTWAWGQISNAEAMVQWHAAIYCQCRKQLIALGAGEDILGKYQELNRADLTDCWEEELELLTLETGWTQKFSLHKEKFWSGQHMEALAVGNTGFTCYMARQSQMYQDLARTLGCTSRYELEE